MLLDKLVLAIAYTFFSLTQAEETNKEFSGDCDKYLSKELIEEIASYDELVRRVINYTVHGPYKGQTYDGLAQFVDKFGSRRSGTTNLEDSIDYMIRRATVEGISKITTENVTVPNWVRGPESVTMLQPRVHKMSVLGFGTSVSTPPEGITAEVIVVDSFEELEDLDEDTVRNKIVLFNPKFTTYAETVEYRSQAATKAAQKGAIASLVRSIAPFSINSPHTGVQYYDDNITKIPTAAITLEDASLIKRMRKRNETVVIEMFLNNTMDEKVSRNVLLDVKGTQDPDKLVIVSGHIDSWDVGQGAMDDGGGMMISFGVPVILKKLGLTPKRTIRSILWTGEELGLIGAAAYAKKHKEDLKNINFIMESDEGTFKPTGLTVAGTPQARCIIREILKLFTSINATKFEESDSPGSDITLITAEGVPGASLLNKNEKYEYFWFHHTDGDTMNVENSDELDLCAAFWTAVAYVIADISVDIPRELSTKNQT